MEAAANFFDEGALFPPLPDDLDDLFTEDLMRFLSTELPLPEGEPPAAGLCAGGAMGAPAPTSSAEVGSTGASSCHSEGSSPFEPSGVPVKPAAAGSAGTGAVRLVTTGLLAGLTSNCTLGPKIQDIDIKHGRSGSRATGISHPARSGSNSLDSSGDSSDTDAEMEDTCGEQDGRKGGCGNKRKAPEVDWRAIEDPAERRRQRRLAKNRVTAARSRERKKMQWSEMEAKLQGVENENLQLRAMLEQFARENATLKQQLMSLAHGPAGAHNIHGLNHFGKGSSTEPAVLILIATLLVLYCLFPSDQALALMGSAIPVMLIAQMLRANEDCAKHAMDALFKLAHALETLLSSSKKSLRCSMHKLLYQRHTICGNDLLSELSSTPQESWGQNGAESMASIGDGNAYSIPHSCKEEPPLPYAGVVVKPEPVY